MLQESVSREITMPNSTVSPQTVTIGAVGMKAAIIRDGVGGELTNILLDLGSSVSLVRQEMVARLNSVKIKTATLQVELLSASGQPMKILDDIQALVHMGELHIYHDFVIVNSLVAAVILGTGFLQQHSLVLDFTRTPVQFVQYRSMQVSSWTAALLLDI